MASSLVLAIAGASVAATASRGDWLEVPDGAAIKTNDGVWLCPVMNEARTYRSTEQAQRMLCKDAADAKTLAGDLREQQLRQDAMLEELLTKELMSQRKPRAKKKAAPSAQAASAERRQSGGSELAAEGM